MTHCACGTCRQVEGRHGRLEDIFWHLRDRLLDSYRKWHLVQDVVDREARCNLNQRKSIRVEAEHGTLRDVEDNLSISSRLLGTECQLLDLIDKFFVPALERKTKTHEPRALCDIDKTAGADHASAQTAHVDVALLVDLTRAHESRIQSPTVV